MNLKTTCRRGIFLLCAVMLLCVWTPGAAAAEKELSVQLDGQPVAFTDAYPENRENRNFLPFRAMFDALGAEVSYDDYTHTATAVRGDTTVDVPIGTNRVIVTRNGEREVIEMDVCSYVKDGRTYVPVRFMAQALGCMVEWDQENVTIILIDMEKLLEEAVEGREYTVLDGCRALLNQFASESWAMEGQIEYAAAYGETVLSTAAAQYHGLTAEDGRAQVFLTMNADYSVWYQIQAEAYGKTLEELGVGGDDLYPFIELETRADTAAGTSYLYVSRAGGIGAAVPLNTWLVNTSAAEVSGVELELLTETGKSLNVTAMIRSSVENLDLTDSTTAMELARKQAFELAYRLSDAAASEAGDTRILSWTVGDQANVLTAGYSKKGELAAALWEQSTAGTDTSVLTQTAVDTEGNLMAAAVVEGNGQTISMIQSGRYTPAETLPQTTLPEGVEAISYGNETEN